MKKFLILIFVWILALYIARHFLSFFDDLVLLISFFVIIKHKDKLSDWFLKLKLPFWAVYILGALPFMLFEENVNCLPSGCRAVPLTIPFLIVFLFILLFFITKLKLKKFWPIVTTFSIFGVLFEFFFGAASAVFKSLPFLWLLIVALWTWLSYAFFTIVPVNVVLRKKKRA